MLDRRKALRDNLQFAEPLIASKGDSAPHSQRLSELWWRDLIYKLTASSKTFTEVVPDHDTNSHPMRGIENGCIRINID
jgi:hypothetical protein